MDSKNRISDVSLDNVSGGMVFNNTSGIDGADPDFRRIQDIYDSKMAEIQAATTKKRW